MTIPSFLRTRFFLFEGATRGVVRIPVRLLLVPSGPYGWFNLGLGLLYGSVGLIVLFFAPWSPVLGRHLLVILLMGFLFAAGVAGIVIALTYLRCRFEIDFGETSVRVRERGLHGWHEWSASYDDFLGVRDREAYFGRYFMFAMEHEIWQLLELVHPDPTKTVPLHAHLGTLPPRQLWERSARALGLSAVSVGPRGPVFRRPDSLNWSLAERIAMGELVPQPPHQPPPPGLRLERRQTPAGPLLSIALLRSRLPLRNRLWLLLIFSFPLIATLTAEELPTTLWGNLAALLPAALLVWALIDRLKRRVLVLGSDGVRWEDALAQRGTRLQSLAYEEIEDVRIVTTTGRIKGVAIESDTGRILAGKGLPSGELGWLHDFLVAETARRSPRPSGQAQA